MRSAAALYVAAINAGSINAFSPASSHVSGNHKIMAAFKARNTIMHATQQESSSTNPFQSFIGNLFPAKTKEVEPEKPKIPDFTCDSDYKLGVVFVAIGAVILAFSAAVEHGSPSILGGVAATLHALLGSLFLVQAYRIRFVFDETSFELKNVGSDDLTDSGENFVVGGANRWTYDSFVNYDFFPSVEYPILVYFKETQTPQKMWNEGPGEFDKVGGGQIHFFPAIANVNQLKEQFELRECAKV